MQLVRSRRTLNSSALLRLTTSLCAPSGVHLAIINTIYDCMSRSSTSLLQLMGTRRLGFLQRPELTPASSASAKHRRSQLLFERNPKCLKLLHKPQTLEGLQAETLEGLKPINRGTQELKSWDNGLGLGV